ncbi:MAG TPA: site-2 protease family protein [Lacipirellula sp.]
MCLIAAIDWSIVPWWVPVVPVVALGLGAVIFVHELGHFLVAKACGVKCEKFFIGFDIGGYKISRKWGETEYGIGILPLGGYVKMLGQDDNPANIAEQVRESEVSGGSVDAKEIVGPDGKTYLVDKRSYLAKSVPQRMAIISAGVIMNVIFAFIFATVAFKIGVPYHPTIVSSTAPGSPAWEAGLLPGDEIVRVGDIEKPSFTDLMGSVTLADLERGLPFVIERDSERIELTLRPVQGSELARIGVTSPVSLRLRAKHPVLPHGAAAKAEPALQSGDEIVKVDGRKIDDYAALTQELAQHSDDMLTLTVLRGGKKSLRDPFGPLEGGKLIEVKLQPRPRRTLGLVMQMGKIVAVQEKSPAAEAGIRPGDFIDEVRSGGGAVPAGEADIFSGDPMKLPDELHRLAEDDERVTFTLRRAAAEADGRQPAEEAQVALREVTTIEEPLTGDDPLSAPAAGLAYRVLSVVDRVEEGSPAAKAGLQADDVLLKAEAIYPDEVAEEFRARAIEFSQAEKDDKAGWPAFMRSLQDLPEGAKVKLTYRRGDQTREATLAPVVDEGYHVADRGLLFEPLTRIRESQTWAEAASRGYEETTRSLTMVYRFLNKLGTGQVPVTMLGGPITIAQAAGFSAFEGVGKLLVFLTMLSANLAVINFLPIPLLDGGHMVFLAWEGIRGKPAGERFVVAMHTVGFVFIITLMLFVFSLDIRRIFFT